MRISGIVAGDPAYRTIAIGDTTRRITPEAAKQLAIDIRGDDEGKPSPQPGTIFTAPTARVTNDFVIWSTGAVRRDVIRDADKGCPCRLVLVNGDCIAVPEVDFPAVLQQLAGGRLI